MAWRLPSPRQLLTSLISSFPLQCGPGTSSASTTSNPLKSCSAADRAILATLHVLFPSLLLQALDLLDRGLVTGVVLAAAQSCPEPTPFPPPEPEQEQGPKTSRSATSPQLPIHPSAPVSNQGPATCERGREAAFFYLVRSAQPDHHHRRASTPAGRYGASESGYTVRLKAWNCTCPSFAFSAFTATTSTPAPEDGLDGVEVDEGVNIEEKSFGGLSFNGLRDGDGEPDGAVPCCKHLLACLLAERWKGVLGGFVKEKRVGREEMAGLGAG